MTKRIKTPWPTKDAMDQIYDKKLWGGTEFDFYSGSGSHDINIVEPYVKAVISFLESQNNNLSVCDLGCGDFNIGKQLHKHTKKYMAADIVEGLINRNKKLYQTENLQFYCLDIAKDKLPVADCIILRQVLQHISNAEILNVVKNLINYKYIILTEHLPIGDFIPNKNIISGQGIRLKQNSGVNLLKAPFNLKVTNETILNEHILESDKGRIVTILFELF